MRRLCKSSSKAKASILIPIWSTPLLNCKETFRNIALTFADYEEERQMLGGGKDLEAEKCISRPVEKILLVEDNEINREIMQSQLTAMGYRVDLAVNGTVALNLYQKKAYDVILTDIEMPEMNGYELTAEVRRLEGRHGSINPYSCHYRQRV